MSRREFIAAVGRKVGWGGICIGPFVGALGYPVVGKHLIEAGCFVLLINLSVAVWNDIQDRRIHRFFERCAKKIAIQVQAKLKIRLSLEELWEAMPLIERDHLMRERFLDYYTRRNTDEESAINHATYCMEAARSGNPTLELDDYGASLLSDWLFEHFLRRYEAGALTK